MDSDLPFRAEYAKSNRAGCKGCNMSIGKDSLRIAAMVQSPVHDGKTPRWYHFACFFNKLRPKTVDDIEHYESLRIEDQDKIKARIDACAGIIVPDAKKGKKRSAQDVAAKKNALKDFRIEYAKSGRSTCRGCEQKILKDEVRISKKDFETEVGLKYGGQDMWHHLTCFEQLRSELGYFESADKLPGFKELSGSDKDQAKKALPAIKQEQVVVKKPKLEEDDDLQKLYREQNIEMFKHRDSLKDTVKTSNLEDLLVFNNQQIPSGKEEMLDRLADVMTFGALQKCDVCKNGQLVFDKYNYVCHGNLTEWTKCTNSVEKPNRKKFKIPVDLLEEYPFLQGYKSKVRVRAIKPSTSPRKSLKDEPDSAEPKIKRELPPLYNMDFVLLGSFPDKDEIKSEIMRLGGKLITKIGTNVMAIISNEAEVEKMSARMAQAQTNGIHVVPREFLTEARNHTGKIPELIIKLSLCDWGSDPNSRLPPEPSSSKSGGLKSKSKSIYTSTIPSKVRLKLKGGGAVDPESGLDDVAHIYRQGDDKYTVVLGKTDIQAQKNSYYKIQLLESDKSKKYWVFRSWGRIGTTIGSTKLESHNNIDSALEEFTECYEKQTGNSWEMRKHFVKNPRLYYPIDVDYEDNTENFDIVEKDSKLPSQVQNLIRLIFDVNLMKEVMLEFELDMEKMPLGKLSKKQIQDAFKILNELQNLIDESAADNKALQSRFIDASNRFYTHVPHSFGIENPPILKTAEQVSQKLDMLDNLMELEIAYNLMKSTGSEHTVDSYYERLNTDIEVVPSDSEEFKLIEEYVRNTHASTHSSYALEIESLFKVRRQGEEKRFKPFKKLHNRKLLWHGSRITNFAGILSQGLRIAPPEAPCTGYMFGKGIYFADMVSKSANYCATQSVHPTGLLLLCDVALGNMYERTRAEHVTKLPKGKHSCKGLGRTQPDPSHVKQIDGVDVPLGKGVPSADAVSSDLLYNEFIVYDVAQVNIKYLIQLKFKFKL